MKAKIGAIFLVSVMAFAALGAAYAHWEETLTIEGTMETDDIDPFFDCPGTNDPPGGQHWDPAECGEWINAYTTWDGDYRDKDVGSCSVYDDENYLYIDIEDAYPCYYAHPMFCIKNRGSCPVQVYGVKLVKLSYQTPEMDAIEYITVNKVLTVGTQIGVEIYEKEAGVYKARFHDPVKNDVDDFSIMLTGEHLNPGVQLDPWQWGNNPNPDQEWTNTVADHMEGGLDAYTDTLYGDLCIHFENGCEELTHYDFTIELVFWNWPEVIV